MRSGLFFCLWYVASAQAVTLADVENTAGLPWTEKFRASMVPLLQEYNGYKQHKAIAVAVSADNRRVELGRAWGHSSQISAAQLAMQNCETNRKERPIEDGVCEVVLTNDTVVPLGASYFDDVSPSAPSNVWRVKQDTNTLYLVGTIHVLKPTIFPLPPVFDIAYRTADQIALESNVLLFSDPARAAALQKEWTVDPKKNKRSMPRAVKRNLKRYLKQHGGKISPLYGIKPAIVNLQLGQISNLAHGYSGEVGVETYYARQAVADGKAILELEDPVATTRVMTDLPITTQFLLLGDTLEHLDSLPGLFQQLLSVWIKGDPDQLYELATAAYRQTPELQEFGRAFIEDRNHGMLKNMLPYFDTHKTTTVMVGAAHLGGPEGLLNLLRQKGFAPVQLSMSGELFEG